MTEHFDSHFQKNIITINPGEFFSTKADVYIATVLGSCISIALFDTVHHFGGLNHFMLPSCAAKEKLAVEEQGRYGDFAIEQLINELLKQGADKKSLCAKVFGGANVLESGGYHQNMTGFNNISFALNYLETEHIPIVANDTGGIYPRKIYFHPRTAKVYLKRIQKTVSTVDTIKKREKDYEDSLQKQQASAGDITWF